MKTTDSHIDCRCGSCEWEQRYTTVGKAKRRMSEPCPNCGAWQLALWEAKRMIVTKSSYDSHLEGTVCVTREREYTSTECRVRFLEKQSPTNSDPFDSIDEILDEILDETFERLERHSPRKTALETLGLERSASLQEIRSAYHKLATAHHPDRGGDVGRFNAIQNAYEVLL